MKAWRVALLIGWAAAVVPAAGGDFVPFVIPHRADPNSLIAMPPSAAIRPDGPRLTVRDGHFALARRRVRIWGVNLCFGANFPAHADAERLAERLAAGGINGVRLHHMDATAFPRGIWDRRDPKRLSPDALDRLDYLIDQLARRGIWVNLNLHVSRTHSRVLKLPDADKLRHYDKIVDVFTPALIDAQKAYARDLLGHVNAYRKVRYAADPAVAFVEISNEDSLFMWGAPGTLRTLPPYYARILQGRFIAWLKARHGTTAGLRAAWSKGAEPLGKNQLKDPGFATLARQGDRQGVWRVEAHGGSAAQAVKTAAGARVRIAKADTTGWHVQFNQSGLAVKGGRYHTVSFRARADKNRRIAYNVGQAHDPWKMLGLTGRADLTPRWQTFRAGFVASADDANARVNFQLGASTVSVELADVQFRPGGREGLKPRESIEAANVALFAGAETDARMTDRWRFLAATEKAYFDGMRTFIRNDLGCKALVTGTIVFGPLGLLGQSGMDYTDAHAYWQHPRFPGRPWDPGNWLVEQKPMVGHPGGGTLFGLASRRLAGRPFTVSEYNHPAPSDYQVECVPMIASFAAAQDWDGIWLFAYSHRTDDWDRQAFGSFFDIDANSAKWGFVRAGAAIFRDGGIAPLAGRRTVALGQAPDGPARLHARHGGDLAAVIGAIAKVGWEDCLRHRLAVGWADTGPHVAATTGRAPPGLLWQPRGRNGGAYRARGPGAWAWVGHKGEAAGAGLTITSPEFAAVTVTALDGRALQASKKVLITACGRCENTDMGFSKDRRTVGRNWGKPPVRIEAVTGRVALPSGRWRCVALGPDGRAAGQVQVLQDARSNRPAVTLSPERKTMWYLLTRK